MEVLVGGWGGHCCRTVRSGADTLVVWGEVTGRRTCFKAACPWGVSKGGTETVSAIEEDTEGTVVVGNVQWEGVSEGRCVIETQS